MPRSSSAKKVARAARTGSGRRARQTGERNLLFPAAMVLVVVLGLLAVWWARSERDSSGEAVASDDTALRVAYGVYVCDTFASNLPSDLNLITSAGVTTFGDGLFYVPPDEIAGATLGDAFDEADAELSDEAVRLPGGTSAVEGETTCGDDEVDGELRVVKWDSLTDDEPVEVTTSDLREVVFDAEGQSITIAFVPADTPDADIPRPQSDAALADHLGVDTEPVGGEGGSPSTTAPGGTTTVAPTTAAPTTTGG